MPLHDHHRRGISLLEVLISIGILSIGLASVLALLPAGGSEAKKAMIEDRRSAMGSAALADLITRGFLRPANWTGASEPPIVVDPLGQGGAAADSNRFPAVLQPVTLAFAAAMFYGSDDLSFSLPEDESLPPAARRDAAGEILNEQNFSWLATLIPVNPSSSDAPAYHRLSVVEFYKRPFDATAGVAARRFAASFAGSSAAMSSLSLTTDEFKSFFGRGAVVLVTNNTSHRWLKVLMAAPTDDGNGTVTGVDLEFNEDVTAGPYAFTPTFVYAYAGAVGVAEKIVRLEEDSPWVGP